MNDLVYEIAKLRTCVAFLGEKEQSNWWSSSFLSSSGAAFLTPVFPKTSLLARVNGASTAAQVVHDEHIGVGNVYHLFRLPENIEREVARILTKEQSFSDCITSVDAVYSNLQSMSESETAKGIGPLLLEESNIEEKNLSQMASAYLAGFQNQQEVYPYYRSHM